MRRTSSGLWAVVPLVVLLLALTADAKSNGALGTCDLTPRISPDAGKPGSQMWPNGYFGANWSSLPSFPNRLLNAGNMYWVNNPVPNAAYTLRAGDGPLYKDLTSYIPGEAVELHVRIHDADMAYIGLLLYATNNSGVMFPQVEAQVGSWQIMPNDLFQVAPTAGSTCRSAVTHVNADIKPVHVKFLWTGRKGTGKVKFRFLLKQGEQNSGSFFYPPTDLVLSEAPGPTPASIAAGPMLAVGDAGQSCATVCAATPSTPYCNAAAMRNIDSDEKLDALIGTQFPAATPYISSCVYAGPPSLTADGYASYRSNSSMAALQADCPASYVEASTATPPLQAPDVCWVQPLDTVQALCLCDSDNTTATPNPYVNANGKVSKNFAKTSAAASGASADKNHWALTALLLALGTSSRGAVVRFMALVCCLLAVASLVATPAAAHNYISGIHRATAASIQLPCIARIGPQPHVQVVPGQTFESEWTSGHGKTEQIPFWFAVLHSDDYDELKLSPTALKAVFQDYLNNAPDSAVLKDPKWDRHHIALKTDCFPKNPNLIGNSKYVCNKPKYFVEGNGTMASDDPNFIVRDPVYKAKSRGLGINYNVDDSQLSQNTLLPSYLANDKRASYQSAKYPWLESVHMFNNLYDDDLAYPGQIDLARFYVDARKGPGDYIMYFAWSGYGDCIDVNVQTPQKGAPGFTSEGQILNRYGNPNSPNTTDVVRMDHCDFTYIPTPMTQARILSSERNVSQCVDDCVGNKACNGVVVTRVTNVPMTMYKPVNIPWHPWSFNITLYHTSAVQNGPKAPYTMQTLFDPCFEYRNNDRELRGCKSPSDPLLTRSGKTAIQPADDDYLCFGIAQYRQSDLSVSESYRVVSDPVDPAWYSTCLFPISVGGFVNLKNHTQPLPSWKQTEHCVKCDFHASLMGKPTAWAPDWSNAVADVCRDCDAVLASGPTTQIQLTQAYPQMNADGTPYSPANGEQGDSSDSSSRSGLMANKTTFALVLVGIVAGAVLLLVTSVLAVRWCKSRSVTHLRDMQTRFSADVSPSTDNTELARNPAAAVDW